MKIVHVFTVFTTADSFFDGQFKYLSEQGYEVILISNNDLKAQSFAERNKVTFIPVEMPRALAPIAMVKAIKAIVQIIKELRPDAVFGHTPVGALCAMIASKICGVRKRIYFRHGVIYTTMAGIKREVFRMEEKIVAALSTAIINVSYSLNRLSIRDNLNSDLKQYVIGHGTCGGIDAENLFNPIVLNQNILKLKQTEFQLKDADIVFGFCGRICKDKGIPELLDGFELFLKLNPSLNAKLLLVGGYDARDKLSEKQLNQIESNKNIVITGSQSKTIVPYCYALMDVFVFPSHREGFGMSVIEASAMEKAILVSHSHGCEDTIVEHVTGEYIDLTPESICKGMEMMLNEELRNTLGKSGRKKVLEWYDFKVMWPLVCDIYKRILT